jgi:hypothetical protein
LLAEVFKHFGWQSLRHTLILTGFRNRVKNSLASYRGFR